MKYACELCGYIYDENIGDPRNGILPGTEFGQLPGYYECPGCGCEKEAFDPLRSREIFKTQSHIKRRPL